MFVEDQYTVSGLNERALQIVLAMAMKAKTEERRWVGGCVCAFGGILRPCPTPIRVRLKGRVCCAELLAHESVP